jgi:hypothetical protein
LVNLLDGVFLGTDALIGLGFLSLGGSMLILPALFKNWSERKHAERLAKRLERGTDAYHEELRSLEAYTPLRNLLMYRAIGVVLIANSLNIFWRAFSPYLIK